MNLTAFEEDQVDLTSQTVEGGEYITTTITEEMAHYQLGYRQDIFDTVRGQIYLMDPISEEGPSGGN